MALAGVSATFDDVARPDDLHEYISFDDPDEQRTWMFDATFLRSNWNCIWGNGCKGVLTEDATDQNEGCCSYGAHSVSYTHLTLPTIYSV